MATEKTYYEVRLKKPTQAQKRRPYIERIFTLALVEQTGRRRDKKVVAELNGNDRDILMVQFFRKSPQSKTITKDDLKGETIEQLLEEIPFIHRLRQATIRD